MSGLENDLRSWAAKPSPATLLDEINMFDTIRKAQKELKKPADHPVPARKGEVVRPEPENRSKSVADTHEVPPPAKPSAN